PTTDSTGHKSARNHNAGSLSPGTGLLPEGNAASLPRRGGAGRHNASGGNQRRVRRALAFVEGLDRMESLTAIVRRLRGPGHDTAGVGLASLYRGNHSRFSSEGDRYPGELGSGGEGFLSDRAPPTAQ